MTRSAAHPPNSDAYDLRTRIDQILLGIRLRVDFYCQVELSAPWALEMPRFDDSLSFHVVTEGRCTLELDGQEPVHLRAGEVALVPHGRGHVLRSEDGEARAASSKRADLLPQEYLGPLCSKLIHGGGGEPARLVCGLVGCEEPAARELTRRMPLLLFMTRDSTAASSRVLDCVQLMGEELATRRIGGDVIASRLADIIVLQAIRAWLAEASRERTGWFAAINDERIGSVLLAMHDDPGYPWDVAGMARLAAMSRSLFSARFAQLMGEPPMTYLTRWRMDQARLLLAEDKRSIAQIAQRIGYGSEATFIRAFSRTFGTTPGTWRREAHEDRKPPRASLRDDAR